MTDLKVLISTLPVKGEESLDLQPSVTPTEPRQLHKQLAKWWRPSPWVPGLRAGRLRFVTAYAVSAESQALHKYAHDTGQYASAYTQVRVLGWSLGHHGPTHSHCFHHMFINVAPRTSDAVAQLLVSPVLGVVLVEFQSGHAYEYTNVSRRAIMNLLINPSMSLGFWFNRNCIKAARTLTMDLNFYTTDGEYRGAAGFIGA